MSILGQPILPNQGFLPEPFIEGYLSVLDIDVLLVSLHIGRHVGLLLPQLIVCHVCSISCPFIEHRFAFVPVCALTFNGLAPAAQVGCLVIGLHQNLGPVTVLRLVRLAPL